MLNVAPCQWCGRFAQRWEGEEPLLLQSKEAVLPFAFSAFLWSVFDGQNHADKQHPSLLHRASHVGDDGRNFCGWKDCPGNETHTSAKMTSHANRNVPEALFVARSPCCADCGRRIPVPYWLTSPPLVPCSLQDAKSNLNVVFRCSWLPRQYPDRDAVVSRCAELDTAKKTSKRGVKKANTDDSTDIDATEKQWLPATTPQTKTAEGTQSSGFYPATVVNTASAVLAQRKFSKIISKRRNATKSSSWASNTAVRLLSGGVWTTAHPLAVLATTGARPTLVNIDPHGAEEGDAPPSHNHGSQAADDLTASDDDSVMIVSSSSSLDRAAKAPRRGGGGKARPLVSRSRRGGATTDDVEGKVVPVQKWLRCTVDECRRWERVGPAVVIDPPPEVWLCKRCVRRQPSRAQKHRCDDDVSAEKPKTVVHDDAPESKAFIDIPLELWTRAQQLLAAPVDEPHAC